MLSVENLTVKYGHIEAVKGISFDVREGEIVSLLGPNGAGKTSTLAALMNLVTPQSGKIVLAGENISSRGTAQIVQRGMTLSPEGRRVFPRLSVEKNLLLGGMVLKDWRNPAVLDRMYSRFPILAERRTQLAGTLSGGEQQMLAIARALMASPKMLLLDEPSLGIAPKIVAENFELICQLRDEGLTILLVEQNVFQSLSISDRAYVLENGRIAASGNSEEMLESDLIRHSYLGVADPTQAA
ncbi:ABC transporter ATP-binding protein [Rhizobium leguminosarum]|uniref:ABC transporter ATP-binding protein n=1 Tax=Rhizobium leguminosarum TaxID=384 RepID=UPI00143F605F|nr:ABC transporter ATP-binding protein [Rhizobium leguminosarum]NKL21210.1 ATP-binding cassette domain-containing protein [Rhizobium leguminosarum bv. viciae]NKL56913.1 ATP-binding cassette domain-containing protein [Rhizobium leguminosarum bv. viciae]